MANATKRLNTGAGILCFPSLVEAKENKMANGRMQFDCQIIFEKGSKEHKALERVIAELIEEQWGTDAPDDLRNPLKDGDAINKKRIKKGKSPYGQYENAIVITPWCEAGTTPDLYDGQELLEGDDRANRGRKLFYSGATVMGLVNAYCYDNTFGAGLNFGLLGVQFAQHGQRLAGGAGGPTNDLLASGVSGTNQPGSDEPDFG